MREVKAEGEVELTSQTSPALTGITATVTEEADVIQLKSVF